MRRRIKKAAKREAEGREGCEEKVLIELWAAWKEEKHDASTGIQNWGDVEGRVTERGGGRRDGHIGSDHRGQYRKNPW